MCNVQKYFQGYFSDVKFSHTSCRWYDGCSSVVSELSLGELCSGCCMQEKSHTKNSMVNPHLRHSKSHLEWCFLKYFWPLFLLTFVLNETSLGDPVEIIIVVKRDTRLTKISFQVFPPHLYQQLWHNDQSFFYKVCLLEKRGGVDLKKNLCSSALLLE